MIILRHARKIMPIPMVNLVEFKHVVAVLDGIAGRALVTRALREAGITRKALTAEPGFVPYAIEAVFLEAVARALGERHLGARLGLAFDYDAYQSYARYLLGACHLAAAIGRSRRAQPLLHPGSDLVLRQSGEHLVVGFKSGLQPVTGNQHIEEAAIPIITSAARHFLGPSWTPDWVEITDDEQAYAATLEDFVGTPVRSGAHIPAIAIRTSDLLLPNPTPPSAKDLVILSDLPSLLGVSEPRTMQDVVTEALRTQFVLGDMSEEAVSGQLSMGRRRLQRVLKAEGTSFRDVRERFFEARARALLAEPHVSISEIARSLGYSEINSFRRAFRKWTGVSPSTFRLRS
jgi:AraC-like DNA-binding protein